MIYFEIEAKNKWHVDNVIAKLVNSIFSYVFLIGKDDTACLLNCIKSLFKINITRNICYSAQ